VFQNDLTYYNQKAQERKIIQEYGTFYLSICGAVALFEKFPVIFTEETDKFLRRSDVHWTGISGLRYLNFK